jgi:ubiquinone/menaquinone biosynthesis C-methylase UbiE
VIDTTELAYAFDEVAAHYDEDGRHEEIARRLVEAVGPIHGSVVDVACGTGAVSRAVVSTVASGTEVSVLAIDVAPAMIARGRAMGGISDSPNITWRVGRAVPLPVPDGGVDVVLCASSLHFLGLAAMTDWRRALRPGGLVGYTLPLPSRFRPRGRFVELLAQEPVLPANAEEARLLAEDAGFVDVVVSVLPDVVVTTATNPD